MAVCVAELTVKVVAAVVPEADAASLRVLANAIRAKFPHGVIALVGTDGENASIFAGDGWQYLWDQVASGALEIILPDWTLPSGIVHAVFPSRRGLSPAIRSLIDFLALEFRA